MKKKRFTEEQMATTIRDTDHRPNRRGGQEARRQQPTIYAWRRRFGTLEPADVKRLRQLGAGKRSVEKDGRRSGSRHVRQWAHAEMSDRGRRVHARYATDARFYSSSTGRVNELSRELSAETLTARRRRTV